MENNMEKKPFPDDIWKKDIYDKSEDYRNVRS